MFVCDGDAVIFLDQLSIPVPSACDVSWGDLTAQLQRFAQQDFCILQVLMDLQWFHCETEFGSSHIWAKPFYEISKRQKNLCWHTVNLHASLWWASRGHDGVSPSIFEGRVVDYQEVFGSLALDSISGSNPCWNLYTVLHPERRSRIQLWFRKMKFLWSSSHERHRDLTI